MKRLWKRLYLPALIASLLTGQAWAQQGANQPKTYKLTIHPQAVAEPLLKYSLLPRKADTEVGNAAVHLIAAVSRYNTRDVKLNERLDELLSGPLTEMNAEDMTSARLGSDILHFLEIAATRDKVDWDNNIREDGFRTLLPHLGSMRQMVRGVCLEARVAMKDSQWNTAVHWLCVNFAMAHDLGQGDTLIEALVGEAIAEMTTDQVFIFAQQPGAPNLYWPLQAIAKPLIDPTRPFIGERTWLYFTFPELKEARDGKFYAGQWQAFARHLTDSMQGGNTAEKAPVPVVQVTSVGLGLAFFGPAKKYLLSKNFSEQVIDAMPVEEVLMRYASASYEIVGDEMLAWSMLPYWQGMNLSGEEWTERHPEFRNNLFLTMWIPSLTRARFNVIRNERLLAAATVVEAIRDYTAHHDGALPAKLEDVADLPIPVDPVWNRPFEYHVDGAQAVITSTQPPQTGMQSALRVEIAVEK